MSYLTEDRSHPLHFDVGNRSIVEDVILPIAQVGGITRGSFPVVFQGAISLTDVTVTYQQIDKTVTLQIPSFTNTWGSAGLILSGTLSGGSGDPVVPIAIRPATTVSTFAMTSNATVVQHGDLLVDTAGKMAIGTTNSPNPNPRLFTSGSIGLVSGAIITYLTL